MCTLDVNAIKKKKKKKKIPYLKEYVKLWICVSRHWARDCADWKQPFFCRSFIWQWLRYFCTPPCNPSTWEPPSQRVSFVCSLIVPFRPLFPFCQPPSSLDRFCCLYVSLFFTLYQNCVFYILSTAWRQGFRLVSPDLVAWEQRDREADKQSVTVA